MQLFADRTNVTLSSLDPGQLQRYRFATGSKKACFGPSMLQFTLMSPNHSDVENMFN
jgi:hypothetical protein